MRIGINGSGLVQRASIDAIVDHVRQAADDGFSSYWLPEHPAGGLDVMTTLTLVGLRVPEIELGTAIVAIFPRHPMVLAGQVLTLRLAIANKFTLGIGLSHEAMMADLGLPFSRPIKYLKEYLSILTPLVNEGQVSFKGEIVSCDANTFFKPASPTPVIVAALGPQALSVAGRHADGTTLAWVGPRTIRGHIIPRLSAAAGAVGRPTPRVIATLPICVTQDEDGVRQRISQTLKAYSEMPSYKAMFDREGVTLPGELAIVGSEAKVFDQLDELARAGVTDFAAAEFTTNRDEKQGTRALLKEFARRL